MKKTTVALATLAALSSFHQWAQAQSGVTLYGVLDAGIQSFSNQNLTNHSNTTFAGNGGELSNAWGLKGIEDIGSGMKVVYTLEGAPNLANGRGTGLDLNSNGGLFGRQAFVGLIAPWGLITLGQQADPAFVSFVATDPRGTAQSFSGLQTWVNSSYTSGVAGDLPNTYFNIFDSNAVGYRIKAGHFDLGLLYGFGGQTAGSSNGSIFSVGATYQEGGLVISAGAYHDRTANADTSRVYNSLSEYHLGLGYSWSDWSVKGFWMQAGPNHETQPPFTTVLGTGVLGYDKFSNVGVGGAYKWSPALSFNAAYYQNHDSTQGGHMRMFALGADYALSKHTGLYGMIGSAREGGGKNFGGGNLITMSDATIPYGDTANGVVLGMHHSF